MAITSESALIASFPGQRKTFLKTLSTNSGWIGQHISTWLTAGQPGAGAVPGSQNGVIPTKATTGAFDFTNPGGGSLSYLSRLFASIGQPATLIVYDRVLAASGFSNSATPASPTTVTRPVGGAGLELWLEVYSPLTTPRPVSFTYTDQAGNASNVSGSVTVSSGVSNLMIPVPLASGDTGVRSVEAVTVTGGATGGDWGFTIMNRLAEIDLPVGNQGYVHDAIKLGMPKIPDDACIAMALLLTGTAPVRLAGSFTISQG